MEYEVGKGILIFRGAISLQFLHLLEQYVQYLPFLYGHEGIRCILDVFFSAEK